ARRWLTTCSFAAAFRNRASLPSKAELIEIQRCRPTPRPRRTAGSTSSSKRTSNEADCLDCVRTLDACRCSERCILFFEAQTQCCRNAAPAPSGSCNCLVFRSVGGGGTIEEAHAPAG